VQGVLSGSKHALFCRYGKFIIFNFSHICHQ
jgi:hypothetical protein